MRFSVLIILLPCLCSSAPGVGDCTKEDLKECTPFENKLKLYMKNHEGHRLPPEVYDNSTILCGKIEKCYNDLKCKNAQKLKQEFDIRCSKLEYLTGSIPHCLNRFFNAVYQEKYECSKKFDFLGRDLTKKRAVYKDGKSCMVEIAEKVCRQESVDYLKDDEKFGRLLNILTVKPDNDCQGPHHEFSAEQCKPVVNSISDYKIDLNDVKINDPKLLEVIAKCKVATACVTDACFFPFAFKVHDNCDGLKLANTEYGRCVSKLKTKNPGGKYECLGGKWPMDKKDSCKKENKGECMKIVMEGECEEEAVKDFERNFEITKRITCRN